MQLKINIEYIKESDECKKSDDLLLVQSARDGSYRISLNPPHVGI